MKNILLFLGVLIFCFGCTPIIKLAYGFKQPKKINKEVVEKSIKKYGLNDYENYAISDSGFLKLISLSSSVNTFIIFDKNKKLVLQKDSFYCSSDSSTFIDYFNDSSRTILSNKITFQELGHFFRSLNGEKVHIELTNNDYYIILTWANFAGKMNKKYTVEWAKKLKQRTDLKIDIKYLNIDPREFWDMVID